MQSGMILEREAKTLKQVVRLGGQRFASDIDTRKSMTGYLIVLNGGPISWKASRQGGVTLSSSEAELVAASQAGQEVLYLREKYFTLGRLSKGLHTYSMVLQRFGKITRLVSL